MKKTGFLALVIYFMLLTGSAMASEPDANAEATAATTIKLINVMVEQGALTREKADAMINELLRDSAPAVNGLAANVEPAAPIPLAAIDAAAKVLREQVKREVLAELKGQMSEDIKRQVLAELTVGGTAVAAADNQPDPAAKPVPRVVRVPYVPDIVKNEMREQIKQEVMAQAKTERWGDPGAMPDWISRISWNGDMRLRYEMDRFPDRNNISPAYLNFNLINSKQGTTTPLDCANFLYLGPNCAHPDDRDRLRLRARLGVNAKVNDEVSVGFRLTTTSTTTGATGGTIYDPLSSNQTLGSNVSNKYTLVFDQAYLKLDPVNWITLTGGRMSNPWYGTELQWAPDLGFEGVTGAFHPYMTGSMIKPWLTLGALPLQELGGSYASNRDKWLYGAQLGTDFDLGSGDSAKLGLALYDYTKMHGVANTAPCSTTNPVVCAATDYSAPQFVQKGNSMFNLRAPDTTQTYVFGLASDYRPLNLTASVDLAAFDPVHVTLTGDIVKNIGFKRKDIIARTGLDIAPRTLGYLGKLGVGMPNLSQQGDWQVQMGYRYLERDAVLDAFTDPDFHLGGTDAKGYTLSGSYAFDKHSWFSLKWMSSSEIDNPPLSIDVLQADINVKF